MYCDVYILYFHWEDFDVLHIYIYTLFKFVTNLAIIKYIYIYIYIFIYISLEF